MTADLWKAEKKENGVTIPLTVTRSLVLRISSEACPAVRKAGAVVNDMGLYSKPSFGNEMAEYIDWQDTVIHGD